VDTFVVISPSKPINAQLAFMAQSLRQSSICSSKEDVFDHCNLRCLTDESLICSELSASSLACGTNCWLIETVRGAARTDKLVTGPDTEPVAAVELCDPGIVFDPHPGSVSEITEAGTEVGMDWGLTIGLEEVWGSETVPGDGSNSVKVIDRPSGASALATMRFEIATFDDVDLVVLSGSWPLRVYTLVGAVTDTVTSSEPGIGGAGIEAGTELYMDTPDLEATAGIEDVTSPGVGIPSGSEERPSEVLTERDKD
jgi:hypothetical protein